MGFAHDYLAQLQAFGARQPLPRVRALHLPPLPRAGDSDNANRGEFCAIELDDGSIGLSYVLFDEARALLGGKGGAAAQGLALDVAGMPALDVARAYADAAPTAGARRAIGLAAANALTRCLYDRAGYRAPDSPGSLGGLSAVAGSAVGMIGLFPPLVPPLLAAGVRLTVIELNPALIGEREGYRVTADAQALSGCDEVVSTATLLLNDTLERMLPLCSSARTVAMVGPSAGCLPDALFARGVTALGGSWIEDGPGFLDALRHGAPRGRSARKCHIDRAHYPGLQALLARLR